MDDFKDCYSCIHSSKRKNVEKMLCGRRAERKVSCSYERTLESVGCGYIGRFWRPREYQTFFERLSLAWDILRGRHLPPRIQIHPRPADAEFPPVEMFPDYRWGSWAED